MDSGEEEWENWYPQAQPQLQMLLHPAHENYGEVSSDFS